ncbi:ankyrin repeat domain-containing protein 45 [Scomber japonicus]|uniref:ankyrin repeat domain-containing protein 45 n=1 Tax=Scomber japonicus TaxID=13676 RepID=UPI002305476D|nr:ankyrin repeat domain-containing protein 45 [Scomber japonicus]
MTTIQDEIFKCVLSGDLEAVRQCLGHETETEESQEDLDLFGKKDEAGRNALLAACMLGRSSIIPELLTNGAQVNEQTVRGYSSLHLAACWGHLETVRTLLDLGADTQAKTFRGETPVDLARKYSNIDCVDCLILEEAKRDLMAYVVFVKDMSSDPERSLTKEEKNICTRACSTTSDWIQSVKNPTVSDFIAQRKDMEETLQPVLSKLSAQSAELPVNAAGKL